MMFHCINTASVRPCKIIVTKCTQGNNFICTIYNHIFWHQGYWWRCQMTEYKFLQWRLLVTQRLSSGDSFLLRVTIVDHNRRVERSIYTQLMSLKCILLDSILNIKRDNKAELSSILFTLLTRHLCVYYTNKFWIHCLKFTKLDVNVRELFLNPYLWQGEGKTATLNILSGCLRYLTYSG